MVWFRGCRWYHHIHSCSHLTYFLFRGNLHLCTSPSVNETAMAWDIMRFIFSYFLCTSPCRKFHSELQSVKTKKVYFSNTSSQYKLFLPVGFFFIFIFFLHCQKDQHTTVPAFVPWQCWPITRRLHYGLCFFSSKFKPPMSCSCLSCWAIKSCPDKYCQHLVDFYQLSLSSVMASKKDQAGAAQCVFKPWSRLFGRRNRLSGEELPFHSFIWKITISLWCPWTKTERLVDRSVFWRVWSHPNTMLSLEYSFVEDLWKIIALDLWLPVGLWGSCWETHHLVSSFWSALWGLNYSFRMGTCTVSTQHKTVEGILPPVALLLPDSQYILAHKAKWSLLAMQFKSWLDKLNISTMKTL